MNLDGNGYTNSIQTDISELWTRTNEENPTTKRSVGRYTGHKEIEVLTKFGLLYSVANSRIF